MEKIEITNNWQLYDKWKVCRLKFTQLEMYCEQHGATDNILESTKHSY